MVGWKESKLVDVQRFPKGIAGISQGPQEGQKIPQSSTHFNKQADKTSGTHGTDNTPKFRGDTQNVSSGDKLVIHIFFTVPKPITWGVGPEGWGRNQSETTPDKLACMCSLQNKGGPWWCPFNVSKNQAAQGRGGGDIIEHLGCLGPLPMSMKIISMFQHLTGLHQCLKSECQP